MLKGFRDFVLKGNVIDLAAAVIIGAAFGAIIDSLVKDVITPIIGMMGGQPDFSAIKVGSDPDRELPQRGHLVPHQGRGPLLPRSSFPSASSRRGSAAAPRRPAPSPQEQYLKEIRDLLAAAEALIARENPRPGRPPPSRSSFALPARRPGRSAPPRRSARRSASPSRAAAPAAARTSASSRSSRSCASPSTTSRARASARSSRRSTPRAWRRTRWRRSSRRRTGTTRSRTTSRAWTGPTARRRTTISTSSRPSSGSTRARSSSRRASSPARSSTTSSGA